MIKYLYIFFIFFFYTNSNANNKENIINNLRNINNFNFDFEQNINTKIEKGNCIIEYPKKIYCEYEGGNNKILVSNGKSLVIKTMVSYYRYPLDKTPLNLVLDKKFLINQLYDLEERIIDSSLINYTINKNNTVCIHTCSFDHKNAVTNYSSRGMKIFKTETVII
jgi:outer membrane lipoprotein-sorting protein